MPKKEVVTYTRTLDIPEEKIAEYKEAFDMIDKDKKGTISVNDITKIMKNFGYPISRKEVEKMVAEMDTSGSGELDFEEFVTLMQKQTQYIDESDEDLVLRAFKRNIRAIKCYQKNGFIFFREYNDLDTLGKSEQMVMLIKPYS